MRLLSYNIHKGIGGRDRRYRLERIIQVIEDQNPDLICLQEVDRHVRRIAARRPAPPTDRGVPRRRPTCTSSTSGCRTGVTATSSSRAGRSGRTTRSRSGSRTGSRAGRRWPSWTAPKGHSTWCTGTSAWPSTSGTGRSRHLLEHPLFRQAAHLPTLIVGDFNDWRNTLATGPFAAPRLPPVDRPPLAVPVVPGLLARRVARQGVQPGAVAVRHVRIAHSQLARDASDHLPLVIDFHLDHAHDHARHAPATMGIISRRPAGS